MLIDGCLDAGGDNSQEKKKRHNVQTHTYGEEDTLLFTEELLPWTIVTGPWNTFFSLEVSWAKEHGKRRS
jgi:hypothetical protein